MCLAVQNYYYIKSLFRKIYYYENIIPNINNYSTINNNEYE